MARRSNSVDSNVPQLICFTPPPPIGNQTIVDSISRFTKRWKRKIIAGNIPWDGEILMDTSTDRVTLDYMTQWFENRLMYRVLELVGAYATSEWLVWEMELTSDGLVQTLNMDDVWNAVKVVYTDTSGNRQETDYFIDQTSIDRYLRRELILTLDQVSAAQAISEAESVLANSSFPYPKVVRIDNRVKNRLKKQ